LISDLFGFIDSVQFALTERVIVTGVIG
jgi:hypothetical protein